MENDPQSIGGGDYRVRDVRPAVLSQLSRRANVNELKHAAGRRHSVIIIIIIITFQFQHHNDTWCNIERIDRNSEAGYPLTAAHTHIHHGQKYAEKKHKKHIKHN